MNDDFFFGYAVGSSDNNGGGWFGIGIIIALFVFAYPYLPFAIIGYEIGNLLGGGLNILKWSGAGVGLVVGFWWYFVPFGDFLKQRFKIDRGFKFWLISYLFASALFFVISLVCDNELASVVVKLWAAFFQWAFSVS